jgi:hypothetical protein
VGFIAFGERKKHTQFRVLFFAMVLVAKDKEGKIQKFQSTTWGNQQLPKFEHLFKLEQQYLPAAEHGTAVERECWNH